MRKFALTQVTSFSSADRTRQAGLCASKTSPRQRRFVRLISSRAYYEAGPLAWPARFSEQGNQHVNRRLLPCHAYTRSEDTSSIVDIAPILDPLRQQPGLQHADHASQQSEAAVSSSDLFPASHFRMHGMLELLTFTAYFPFGEIGT